MFLQRLKVHRHILVNHFHNLYNNCYTTTKHWEISFITSPQETSSKYILGRTWHSGRAMYPSPCRIKVRFADLILPSPSPPSRKAKFKENKTKESRQVREMILGKLPKYIFLNKDEIFLNKDEIFLDKDHIFWGQFRADIDQIFCGCQWLSLVVNGCHWSPMVVAGCRWFSLVVIGCGWLLLIVGLMCLSIVCLNVSLMSILKGGYRKIFLFFHKSRWA